MPVTVTMPALPAPRPAAKAAFTRLLDEDDRATAPADTVRVPVPREPTVTPLPPASSVGPVPVTKTVPLVLTALPTER